MLSLFNEETEVQSRLVTHLRSPGGLAAHQSLELFPAVVTPHHIPSISFWPQSKPQPTSQDSLVKAEAQVGRRRPILQRCGQRLSSPSLALWLFAKDLLRSLPGPASSSPGASLPAQHLLKPWPDWEKASCETSGLC